MHRTAVFSEARGFTWGCSMPTVACSWASLAQLGPEAARLPELTHWLFEYISKRITTSLGRWTVVAPTELVWNYNRKPLKTHQFGLSTCACIRESRRSRCAP